MSVSERSAPQAPDAATAKSWVLYLLECAGERLYAGITNDLAARFRAHAEGRGARFTRAFPPLRVVAASTLPSRSAALKAEYALKRQPRSAKIAFLRACGTPVDPAAGGTRQSGIHSQSGLPKPAEPRGRARLTSLSRPPQLRQCASWKPATRSLSLSARASPGIDVFPLLCSAVAMKCHSAMPSRMTMDSEPCAST